ncbi:protein ANKUB1 [Hemicordylus capensis]|uniref:protein ANKUB1 n=1 Tax=Hemicordylus capensis TaxID=884348 RepID=UPI002302A9E4|nr:protein ANKUB1 [Hemicordylus capensis]XP_053166737.1 protein ANKUB1 [Hemicordylus capensis]XP_053166739.1 protein ANKUB1 [Hemicordylus capensis]
MRIFVAFEGLCESFDISSEHTVKDIKLMIKDYFHVPLSEDKQGRRYLELTYAGAVLKDSWILADVGISVSSTIKCVVKEEEKPILYVYNAVTHEKMPIMGRIYLLASKVSQLKTLVTLKCGFPNSIYCLRTPEGREMYDCNTLSDYQLDLGTTLHLDVWDGWKEFLTGCLFGNKPKVQHYLSKEEPVLKYQKRVALYIAAFLGHLQLSAWLLKQGTRPTDAVGVHPYREWCQENNHPDVTKCPVHAAAEAGQLMTLKAFVNYSVLCLECRNSAGQTALQLCIKHKHKDCVLYLVTKMWSVISCPNFSLPMKIYIKLKLWLLKVQHNIHKKKRRKQTAVFRTRIGDVILVDGFTKPKMTSKGFYAAPVKDAGRGGYKWPTLNNQFQHGQGAFQQTISKRSSKVTNLKLPPVGDANKSVDADRLQQKKKSRRKNVCLSNEEDMDQNMYLTSIPLPPISVLKPSYYYSIPKAKFLLSPSLESFSEHSGRTPRENAIYCLAIASAFKEKPWLQQLGIARTLAKKSICKPVN